MNTLFFLHGFTGSAKSWDQIRNQLDDQSIAIDIPGHGKNHFKDYLKPYSFDNWNNEFLTTLNQLKLKKINLCGYSMGGRLAISFAISHPEIIQSLILVSTSAGIKNNLEKKIRIYKDLELSKKIKLDFNRFTSHWENMEFFAKQKFRNPKGFKIQHKIRLSQNPHQLALSIQYLGIGNMPNYWSNLSDFHFPVLVVCGNEDPKYCTLSKKLNSTINFSRLEIINNSGHAPQIDQPKKFTKIIKNFIKS